ncbi:MAG: AmmeMemoRadiSam system protein B [Campylobacterota bacterium]|nr:AmmeMemoRadiSam system protein B [Campylobacterota bacterium]
MSIRQTAVAGQFYPADAKEIDQMIAHYNQILDEQLNENDILQQSPRAVIVPHAGYVYSAFTANIAFRLLANNTVLKRVVVIGPSHRAYVDGTSIADFDSYQTPLGTMLIERVLVERLKADFGMSFNPEAHHEHSTEVQMPFIKSYLPDVSVVELVYGAEEPENLAKAIKYLLDDPTIGIVISTDLSHYYDIEKAKRLDSICLDAVQKEDPAELHQGCEACGKIGVEAMLIAAREKGLKPLLLDYRTSADASGDESQVVGYMSAAFVD